MLAASEIAGTVQLMYMTYYRNTFAARCVLKIRATPAPNQMEIPVSFRLKMAAGAFILAASGTCAMAQATGTENNATSGSAPSSSEQQGKMGSDNNDMKGSMTSSDSMKMKGDTPTSAGTADDQAKDLRGHSETPTTGK